MEGKSVRRHSILFLILITFGDLCSQPNIRSIRYIDAHQDADAIYDVFKTEGDGLAMCGWTDQGNSVGMWLVRTTNAGEPIWQRTYFSDDNPTSDMAYSLVQLDDQGFVLGGRSGESGRIPINFSVLRVDSDGDRIWWNTYNEDQGSRGNCYAVIETKQGNILCAGEARMAAGIDRAYAVLVNLEGDIIWERYYGERGRFYSVKEIADTGYLLAGRDDSNDDSGWLLLADFQGEEIWSHNFAGGIRGLVSSPQGGFGAAGPDRDGWSLLKVNREGEELWSSIYEIEVEDNYTYCYSLASMQDGGFSLAGIAGRNNPCVMRTDSQGNEMWRRIFHFGEREELHEDFNAIITGEDDRIIVAGWGYNNQNRSFDGILMILNPEVSAPQIIRWSPTDLNIKHLISQDQIFRVIAEDIQGDSIRYSWTLNEEEIANRTLIRVQFDNYGEFALKCLVSDESQGDSVTWHITVTDLYISAFTPDTLNLTLRRGATVDFSLDTVRYVGDDEPEYVWMKTNLGNGDQEDSGTEAGATIDFPWSGDYTVEGKTYRGQSSDQVTWNVAVRGVIWAYVPEALAFDVEPESVVHFEVVPSEPENESLSIQWLVDGEVAAEDTVALEWSFAGSADLDPHYQVQAIVADSVEADTVTWEVTVRDLGVGGGGQTVRPTEFGLLSVSPNPFNSMLTIRFSGFPTARGGGSQSPHAIAGGVGGVSLRIYDITGREVANLSSLVFANEVKQSSSLSPHPSSLSWNASSAPAGVYLVRLQSGTEVSAKKVVLMR